MFSFGLISILRDRTSSGASGEDGIYLSLGGLEGHWFVIVSVRDHVAIVVNSKLISMHIKYYVWGVIVVIVFVARTVCIGIIVIVVVIPPIIVIITIITGGIIVNTGGIIKGVVVQGVHLIYFARTSTPNFYRNLSKNILYVPVHRKVP